MKAHLIIQIQIHVCITQNPEPTQENARFRSLATLACDPERTRAHTYIHVFSSVFPSIVYLMVIVFWQPWRQAFVDCSHYYYVCI